MNNSISKAIEKCNLVYNKAGYASLFTHISIMKDNNDPIFKDVVYEECLTCNKLMPSLNHICLVCGNGVTIVRELTNTNVQHSPASIVQVPKFIQNINWEMLREQKERLLELINFLGDDNSNSGALQGIISLIDNVQDYAVDVAGYSETDVFSFNTDDEPDSIWEDVRFDFVDNNIIHVDAWISKDRNKDGITIAKINTNDGSVEYLDERARTDKYAQIVINGLLQL